MTSFYWISASVILAAATLLWWRQTFTKNATSVDAAWALGIGIQTALLAARADGDVLRRVVIAVLVGVWALRLAGHLFFDRVLKGVEDGRYARFRREWSPAAFYGLYVIQGVLVFLLPLTFLAAFNNPRPFPAPEDFLGVGLWILAVSGEAVADRQLARFRADPANRGKTCRDGLWHYSRHPNYFFEWLIWCAYLPLSIGSPLFFVALLGPVLLLVLLLTVSGVPPAEAQALASRGDDYRLYQETTSVFIPWFPKKPARQSSNASEIERPAGMKESL
jgi:steroid 5-alpha reductase family enzyme